MSEPYADDPYPFESDDDIEIRELDLDDVDALAEQRITVSDLAGVAESWRYGHVVVDEAQDLTPMQWRMVMRRVRAKSITVVGDLAQRSVGAGRSGVVAETWGDLLPPELGEIFRQDLTVNYRSPVEIHRLAVAVLAEFAPGVSPSVAIRASGSVPEFRSTGDLVAATRAAVGEALAAVGGQIAVLAADPVQLRRDNGDWSAEPEADGDRVQWLTPNEAKGLEFDAVVLIEPATIWQTRGGAAQLYIALTRATQHLFVLHAQPLPVVFSPAL